MKLSAVYIGGHTSMKDRLSASILIDIKKTFSITDKIDTSLDIDLVILEVSGSLTEQIWQLKNVKANLFKQSIIFIVLGDRKHLDTYLRFGADESLSREVSVEKIESRVSFLKTHSLKTIKIKKSTEIKYSIPLWKRVFDIIFSSIILLCLLPLFFVVSVLIRLESKGKVFYLSSRVGFGYRVFNFYKFRSMYVDADKRVSELMVKNQYASTRINVKQPVLTFEEITSTILIGDEGCVNEGEHLQRKYSKKENAFFKLPNDPRITKVGRFIRNTSIDELPQLINVLIGDMSIVGNRPLPLYEAENLTTDQWSERFLAPSGLTGLWQVTDRAKNGSMSSDSRKKLDIEYARNYCFWGDMCILFKTLPAMFQHENV